MEKKQSFFSILIMSLKFIDNQIIEFFANINSTLVFSKKIDE
jgi:hypothetical protein